MIKIGITGSLASGKTTASKILSNRRGPLFSADQEVKKLYANKIFKSLLSKTFRIENNNQIKNNIKKLVLKNKTKLRKLEKIIHPLVREKMRKFTFKNKNKKLLFYEIPLLIESKLMNLFDVIIFVKSKKKTRLKDLSQKKAVKCYLIFSIATKWNKKKKIKFCDYVVNEKNINILKKNLSSIIGNYE